MSSAAMTTKQFYYFDFPKTLFPLRTNSYLLEHGEEKIKAYLDQCLDSSNERVSFLNQTRVYAAKPGGHVRRTFKLDIAAEYFIYDLTHRNRQRFRKPHVISRQHFGYRFENGQPIPPSQSFKAFRGNVSANRESFSSLSFDVASYFNSTYHHDLVAWFANLGAPQDDYNALGQFLREINSGRSVDCLPQGLYPTKMIGNDFLRFIEEHHSIQSPVIARFMDDIVLFSNDTGQLRADFYTIQKLLGAKGLSVNPAKTAFNRTLDPESEIEDIKKRLLQKRRVVITHYEEGEIELSLKVELSDEEMGYLTRLLEGDQIEEEDAELVLALMGAHTEIVESRLFHIASSFPHLAKSVYQFCKGISDKEKLAQIVLHLSEDRAAQEFQLFWYAYILEDHLMSTRSASRIINSLYNHPNASQVSKAKILEISDQRFGLPELRDDNLGAGQSNWLSWASAVGHRSLPKISRNHRLTYFGKASEMNHLVYSIVSDTA